MKKTSRAVLFFLVMISVLSLACNLSQNIPIIGDGADGPISAQDVSAAATQAAVAAATAGVDVNQIGAAAATAVSQGDDVAATAAAQAAELLATSQAQTLPTIPPGVLGGGSLEQKLSNIQTDANGNFSVPITEEDLNEFITGDQGGQIQTEEIFIENVVVNITSQNVELVGDLTQPITLPLTVQLRPTAVNGRLNFEVLNASAGLFPVPEEMLDLVESIANSELTGALATLPENVTIQQVGLADGVLTISGIQQ